MTVKACYVHIPFCEHICSYCDFCRVRKNDTLIDQVLTRLQEEIKEKKLHPHLKTLYIGGGTPTCLSAAQLEKVLRMLHPYTDELQEYTVEANPENCTEEKIALLAHYGVNRISLGVQSSQEHLLQAMNRKHDFEDVKRCVAQLKEKGITNISCDLMVGLPNQTLEDVKQSVQDVLNLEVTHFSIYSLTVEEHSTWGRSGLQPLDEERTADMLDMVKVMLEEAGYYQYEISNFAKKGYEAQHNLVYWQYDDFYGLGAGASGKENHVRYDNPTNFIAYLNGAEPEQIKLSKEDEMFEQIMMSLRLKRGLNLEKFNERYQVEFLKVYANAIEQGIKNQWLQLENGTLFCTQRGLDLNNSVIELFMES